MSKKDKSKFRKQIKAQLAEEFAKAQSIQGVEKKDKSKTAPAVSEFKVPKPQSPVGATQIASPIADAAVVEFNLGQVKYDLKKTAITVTILAAVIGILYYLDFKNGLLLTFGDWLFTVLHIR